MQNSRSPSVRRYRLLRPLRGLPLTGGGQAQICPVETTRGANEAYGDALVVGGYIDAGYREGFGFPQMLSNARRITGLAHVTEGFPGMLLRHSALYVMGRGLPALLNLLAIAIYTRLLSRGEYGRYALVVSAVGFFNVVFFQWLRLCLLRFMPSHLAHPRPLLSTVLAGFLAVAAVTSGGGLLAGWFWPDPVLRGPLLLGIPLLLAQAWFELNLDLARSRLQPMRYGAMSWTKALVALSIGVLGILLGLGAYGPLLGLVAGMSLSSLIWASKEWQGLRPSVSPALLRQVLVYGLPLTASSALAFVVSASDRFLIAYILGEGQVGPYAAGYDLAWSSIVLLMFFINLAASPLAMRALEQEGVRAARRELAQAFRLQVLVGVPASVGLALLHEHIGVWMFGVSFRDEASELLPWISAAAFCHAIRTYYFDLAFHLGKYTLGQVWVMGGAAVTNVLLNLAWIPSFGLLGAAWATVVAYCMALLLSIVLGRRGFTVPVEWRNLVETGSAATIMALAITVWRREGGWFGLPGGAAIGLVAYVAAMVLLNRGRLSRRFWSTGILGERLP